MITYTYTCLFILAGFILSLSRIKIHISSIIIANENIKAETSGGGCEQAIGRDTPNSIRQFLKVNKTANERKF